MTAKFIVYYLKCKKYTGDFYT